MGSPGLQQRGDHREVLIAEQWLYISSGHHLLQKSLHDLFVEQPLAVLRELGGALDQIIRAQAHKPAEKQVVVELLHQQPLRADPLKRLQQ